MRYCDDHDHPVSERQPHADMRWCHLCIRWVTGQELYERRRRR